MASFGTTIYKLGTFLIRYVMDILKGYPFYIRYLRYVIRIITFKQFLTLIKVRKVRILYWLINEREREREREREKYF